MAALGASLAMPACRVGYLVRSAYFQAELLAAREPIEVVRRDKALEEAELHALDTIEDVKLFGREIGLAATENYGTVALGWDRTIWNLSGCDPLAFEPATWWFPVVGRVPYLGYFREGDARAEADRLAVRGLDVYIRTAGAYSTLGWFEDPILPGMLRWGPADLAETILHELAHATLWIPGSVPFNESFANVVGDVSSFRYLASRHGEGSEVYRAARSASEDQERWVSLLHGVYEELEGIYAHPELPDLDKRRRKAEVFASLGARVEAAGFHNPGPYLQAAALGPWNNARLVQFKTYNANREWFLAVLDRQSGDLLAFMRAIAELAKQAEARDQDPFVALEEAAARG
jgi:predicted aminopeptidase